ncbi:MAG: flavin reductase [Rhodobacterales bacterium]|nr:flavin reductase [Rhodobacterales bacterium]MDX5501802.1 flavin reductase [Rhodobacterales bacterium]
MTDTHTDEVLAHVSREAFRDGMSCLAGAVNIVTTDGPAGRAGFTASAVCSVTDQPPTLLVCINRSSSAAPAFLGNDRLCVNTVGPDHQDLAMLFGGKTPMADRFAPAEWRKGVTGSPMLVGASVSFDCRITLRQIIGTHDVMFCEVVDIATLPDARGSVWFGRRFHELRA